MNITERAALVLQEIDAALALAEKATPGPWIAEDNWVGKDHSAVATTCHYAHDADAAFIAASRTGWPTALRCLKTAIKGLLAIAQSETSADPYEACNHPSDALEALTTLLDQWEASRK